MSDSQTDPNVPSPSHTAVDLPASNGDNVKDNHKTLAKAEQGESGSGVANVPAGDTITDERTGAEHKLSQGRKWFLLLVFSVAQVSEVTTYFLWINSSLSADLALRLSVPRRL